MEKDYEEEIEIEEYEEDFEEEIDLEEDDIWIDEKTEDGLIYRKHQNDRWYLKIEDEEAELFELYKALVSPKGLTTTSLQYGKKEDKPIGELERNALEFVGSLIGFVHVDMDNALCVNVEQQNYVRYQELYWSIHDFMESGSGRDAFNIYFLFMCNVLGVDKYEEVKSIIEMLSNYESNAANLVMSHRDHYVHSVYVFLVGLAIYNSNKAVKEAYRDYYDEYHVQGDKELHDITVDEHFMRFWGITALFHDIGYVYEIPFEQIKSYGKKIKGSSEKIYVAYKQADFWDDIRNRSVDMQENDLKTLCDYKVTDHLSYSLDEIFTYHIKRRLGKNTARKNDWDLLLKVLNAKAVSPEVASSKNGEKNTNPDEIYMDHAYFSAKILFDILLRNLPDSEGLCNEKTVYDYMDSLTAVLMHNSVFKFVIRNKQPLGLKEHPLAFLLMLCDELQIWNRTSFGIDSRGEMHAMGIEMSFGEKTLKCRYWYDKDFDFSDKPEEEQEEIKKNLKKSLKNMYSNKDNKPKFLKDIEEIVEVNSDDSKMNVELEVKQPDYPSYERYQNDGLSDGSLLSIYELARQLWKQTQKSKKDNKGRIGEWEAMQYDFFETEEFGDLTIHIQNSYINRAKALDRYLFECGYFYTDRKLGMHRMGKGEHFSADDEKSIIKKEMDRLRDEMRRYGMGDYADQDLKIYKYALIPPIACADEIMNSVNNITGLSIYRFR